MQFLCVWNPTEEKVSTLIHGSWFTFAPGAFKTMEESKGNFVAMNRKETGLVMIDDPRLIAGSDAYIPGFEKMPEAQEILGPKKQEGVSNLINHHMDIIRNNQVSLRQDLAHKYPTADAAKLAAVHASKGELESMRLVSKYKKKNEDNDAKRVDEIQKLMEDIGPFAS